MLICPANLCHHCGACKAVCPVNIIELDDKGLPFVYDPSKCIDCFLCDRVCSGFQVNFELLASSFHIKDSEYHNPSLGYYKEMCLAYATNHEIHKNSSAGGVITALLHYAFDKNIIDGAVVVRMSNTNPIHAEGYIATSKEDLNGSQQSKYQSVSLVSLLKDAKKFKSIAFVGTGCQIEAVRKFCNLNNEIRKKLKYAVGLFCAYGNNSLDGTKFLIKKLGFRELNKVNKVCYRDGKYPGNFVVEANGKKKSLSKNDYKWFSLLFTENRCMNCIDFTNELADISVGDSYSLSRDNVYGKSIIIIRNQIAKDLVNSASSDGYIISNKVEASDVIGCQRYQFNISKKVIPKRIQNNVKNRNSYYPMYISQSIKNEKLSLKEHFESIITFLMFDMRKLLILFFQIMPISVFKFFSHISKRD